MKRAFPSSLFTTPTFRSAVRGASALSIVALGITLSGIAASQTQPAKAKAKVTATSASVSALPAPAAATPGVIPAGAYSVLFEKGPGLPLVIATQPWPATLLGAAPQAASDAAPAVRDKAASSTAPSNDQELALQQLQNESESYRKGATGYAKALGQIIRQRYELKRKTRLAGLQENIDKDSGELKRARLETIERLKAFLAKYPDVVEHTPNAMFRLAALFEEQAIDADVDPGDAQYTQKLRAAYEPAERLYRDIIAQFPKYSQRASVQFFLGALLADTGRGPESQYVWRALVCANHYDYPPLPAKSNGEEKAREKWKDGIPPMPQDHDLAFWDHWRESHYTPADVKRRAAAAKTRARTTLGAGEDSYTDPYPDDCVAIGLAGAAGEEPRFLSQAWWRIGEYHYSRGDEAAEEEGYFGGSPYRYNRSLSAYTHAIKTNNETVKVFSMYKIAWTLYKQQRYTAAREQFLGLLGYFDEREKKGGDTGDQQMRQDAYDYTAAALTYLDMEGPGPNEPFIEREDVFGQFSGKQLEQKLEVALDRVQDAKIIPQDRPWTPKIYKALAAEFESDEVQLNAIRTYEIILKRWECDSEAPQFQNKIAQLYDLLALKAESQADKDDYASKALEARTKLLSYVGTTKWTECNKSNPDAIHAAEALMTEGVKNAAGRHTALGRAYVSRAKSAAEGSKEARESLVKAREEYQLAEKGWTAYLNQDPDAADSYESKYWIADARHKVVLTTRLLNEALSPALVESAREAAVAVRDSNLDDKYLRYAAYFAVDVYDQLAEEQMDAHVKATCANGVGIPRIDDPTNEPGDACRPDAEKEARESKRIWVRDVPAVVVRTLKERDEFAAKVPPSIDVDKNTARYQFQVADALYRYGRFEEATPRFETLWREHCGVDDYGFQSWYRLAVMSNMREDTKRSVQLVDEAKKKSCATNEDQRLTERNFAEPTKIAALYKEADEAFEAAEKETDPKLKANKYREAAAKYELALKTAPTRPEAPRGAMNAAYCYKQVNEYKRAAEVYRLFLDKYGKEDDLVAYRDGDAKKGIKRDPEQFKTRLDFTKRALNELGRTYLQAFDYTAAAKHYDEVANRTLLDEADRRDAAGNAVILQANLGNREKMLAARQRYNGMKPGAADKAEIDFVVAEFEFKQWKQSPSDGPQRGRAVQALEQYYNTYKGQGPAAKWVVNAAYDVAVARKAASETAFRDWYKKTSDAFISYKAGNKDAVGSRESDFGAEAAYFFAAEQIDKDWDSAPGQAPKIKYEGSGEVVARQLTEDEKKREKYATLLENINTTYVSPKWFPVVLAKQGAVYDVQRTALAKAKVEVFDPKAAKTIKDIEDKAQKTLDNPKATEDAKGQAQALLEKADGIRQNANKAWKDKRAAYFAAIEPAMIDRYTRAYVRGKQFDVRDPMVTRAVQRLAYYTDQLDDTKLRQYTAGVEKDLPPFKYRDQMFKQARPGAFSSPAPNLESPVGPGVTNGGAAKAE